MKTTTPVWVWEVCESTRGGKAISSSRSEDAAKDACRAMNAETFVGCYQVERSLVVAVAVPS